MADELRPNRRLEQLHPQSFGWALACCGWDRAEAEDVLQSTYLKVIEGGARFSGNSAYKTWLFGVIRVTAAERRRKRRRRTLLLQRHARDASEAGLADPSIGPDGQTLRRELLALSARQQEVLHLVFYQDLSIREAAEVMRVGLGTARVHYERGKARLRERLALDEVRR